MASVEHHHRIVALHRPLQRRERVTERVDFGVQRLAGILLDGHGKNTQTFGGGALRECDIHASVLLAEFPDQCRGSCTGGRIDVAIPDVGLECLVQCLELVVPSCE